MNECESVDARLRAGTAVVAASAYRPPTRQCGVIGRPDLVKRLLDGDEARVVVISAPAGYGKTTTLRLWDEADARPFAWVHLEETDNDPTHLLRHVALATNMVQPVDPSVVGVITGAGKSVDTDIFPSVGHWLEGLDPFVLVLDDVHFLTSGEALRCVERLIAFIPPGSQLALSGRSLPPLALARRRMTDGVVDFGAPDLAMSQDEATRLLTAAGLHVDDDVSEDLVRRTEGWPGGLHLAALAMGANETTHASIVSGCDRLVAEYLVEEVLVGLDPDVVSFLERSAVLERMSAPLLDELLGTDRAACLLRQLEQSGNMFLIPLDRERIWYRYHHLFGQVLVARLRGTDPVEARRLERRASHLLEAAGDTDSAVRHASNATDVERAADLVLRHASRLVFQGQLVRLGRWLELLGRDSIERLPAAAIAWAWYGMAIGERALILRATLAAERSASDGPLADGSPSVAVAVAMVKALTGLDGVPGVVRYTELVRSAGDATTNPWWTLATVVRATTMTSLGHVDEAHDLLLQALPAAVNMPGLEAAAIAHLALTELHRGDLVEADRLASNALRIAERHNLDTVTMCIPVFSIGALVAARMGRAEDSRRHANKARRLLVRLDDLAPRARLLTSLLLAQAALVLDRRAEALTHAEEAQRARRRDPAATALNEQLDQLREQLSAGALRRTQGAPPLSPAELRVLPYLTTNLSLQDIADQLYISRNTAKSHSVSIYRKLAVSSRRDAVLEARRVGLLTG